MGYIGTVGKRITIQCTYTKKPSYCTKYGTTYVHQFSDDAGNVIVWKTSNPVEYVDYDGYYNIIPIDSVVELTGTIKEHSQYRDTEQTIVTRCKFKLISKAKTKEQIQAEKAKEQIASLNDGDFVWEMAYKQYKERYSDCETVAGSYFDPVDSRGIRAYAPTIKVIIRKGRLKASGVRGQRFSGYEITNKATGKHSTFRAVCEENAIKQAVKTFPEWKIENLVCTRIYDYRNTHRYF